MLCRDQATTYLQRFGYNVVRHPREGIAPLNVLGRQGGVMAYLGTLDKLMKDPGALPEVKVDQQAANINGQSTGALKLGVGLSLLKSVLSALGGGVGATTQYQQAKTLTFQFDNVLADVAAPLDIAKFLNERVLDTDPLLTEYAEGNGQLYIITETIKTNKLTVTSKRSDGTEFAIEVPAIKGVLKGDVKLEANTEKSATIGYVGSKYLIFGFRCFEIGVEDGEFKLFTSKAGAATAMALASKPAIEGAVLTPDRLLDIDFSTT